MKKISIIILSFFVLCVVFLYKKYDGIKIVNDELKKDQISLRLKWVYDPGFAGELVALKKGFFKKNNLNVTIFPGGFESDPIKLVANGSNTFGVTGADSFLLARQNGAPIVAFAAGYIETPVVFYSFKNSNINTPSDWSGKRIGVQAGQDTETVYRVLSNKFNLNKKDLVEVPVKYDMSMFLDGKIDIWPGYAATQSYILNKNGISYNIIKPSDFGVNYLGTVYFTTEDIIKNKPDIVFKFLKSIIEGWEYTYENEKTSIELISSYDSKSMPADLVKWNLDKQKYSIKPNNRRYCEFTVDDFEKTISILKNQKLLKSDFQIEGAVNTYYLDRYYQK